MSMGSETGGLGATRYSAATDEDMADDSTVHLYDAASLAAGQPSADPPRRPRVRLTRRRWLILAAVSVLLLAVPAVGLATAYSHDIPRGTRVLGVDIGGRSQDQAARVLRDRLADRLVAAVPVRLGSTVADIMPADAGLTLDVQATVAAARARPGPVSALFGRHDVEPVITVDADRAYAALQPHIGDQAAAPVLPAIRYEQLTPKPVYPAPGKGLDRAAAAEALRTGWLRRSPVDIPISEVVPKTTRDDVDRLVRELALPAVAAPVVANTSNGDIEVPPAAIARSLLLEADAGGVIQPRVDEAKLRQALADRIRAVETPVRNAGITIKNGTPMVVPHVDGRTLDVAALARDLLPVLSQPAPRRVTGALIATAPKLTTDAAARLGVKEKISSFTTYFTAGQSRTTNIRRVADTVRGALVLPGETFSLNGHTGERTRAKGYVEAPVIDRGKIKNAPGGGVSQFATTLFNAMYYAGLQDVEHQPHSYYFSRYPPVIEATVVYPDLDLRFRNDSPTGVYIDTSYTATSVTVTMWGTKRYDIATAWGPRTNPTSPKTVYLQEPDCNPTEGLPGFQQEAWRIFKQGGREIKRQRFFWKYDPEPRFICGPPPA